MAGFLFNIFDNFLNYCLINILVYNYREFIGYVDSIGEEANWGNLDSNKRFKFTLNNGQGTRLSICAWNHEAPKVAGIVQFDQVNYICFFVL